MRGSWLLAVSALTACSSSSPAPGGDAAREASAIDAARLEARSESRPPDQAPSPDKAKGPPRWQTLSGTAPAVRYHTASLLLDGRVLVAGGETKDAAGVEKVTAECWLYDPATGFAPAAPLSTARRLHIATLLTDGRVLVTGGSPGAFKSSLSSVEIYDPAKQSWSAGKELPQPRSSHTAERLSDGRVLVIGGFDGSITLSSLAIFNPVANTWSAPIAKLQKDRSWHTSTLLAGTQKVLIVGGTAGGAVATYLDTAEIYDGNTGLVTTLLAKLGQPRAQHSAHFLPGGMVLLVGGSCADPSGPACSLSGDERFEPATDSFTPISHFGQAPHRHAAASLADGRVVVIGGSGSDATKVVVFSVKGGEWTELPSLATGRRNHTATALADGGVLVVGGEGSSGATVGVAERLYDP